MTSEPPGPPPPLPAGPRVRTARNAVYVVFIAAGFSFASWASRIPQIRDALHVNPGVLGLILLSAAVGSAVAIPLAGMIITRIGEARTTAVMAVIYASGTAVIATGYTHGILPVVAGLFVAGFGTAAWDVAMNVQGAAVERALGWAIMPRFHAGWSIGTVAGAALGTVLVALHVPVTAHLLATAAAVLIAGPAASRGFLPPSSGPGPAVAASDATAAGPPGRPAAPRRHPLAAWREPRTLLIGVFVLCVTVIEGTGNDWLSLGVITGFHVPAAVGTATFAVFLSAMTAGRWFGPRYIDRYGRVRMLRSCAVVALAGLALVGFSGVLATTIAGAALMGLGTSLGFPVGLSAAADDPAFAPGRVSTAASIGYAAFLAGPPAIGFVADRAGVLRAIGTCGVLLIIAFAISGATAPLRVPDLAAQPAPPPATRRISE